MPEYYLYVCQHPEGCDNYIAEPTVIAAEELAVLGTGTSLRLHGSVLCDRHGFPVEMRRVEVVIQP